GPALPASGAPAARALPAPRAALRGRGGALVPGARAPGPRQPRVARRKARRRRARVVGVLPPRPRDVLRAGPARRAFPGRRGARVLGPDGLARGPVGARGAPARARP